MKERATDDEVPGRDLQRGFKSLNMKAEAGVALALIWWRILVCVHHWYSSDAITWGVHQNSVPSGLRPEVRVLSWTQSNLLWLPQQPLVRIALQPLRLVGVRSQPCSPLASARLEAKGSVAHPF